MRLVTIDFETAYGDGYTLSSMTTEEYIRDPRFQVIGVGVKLEGRPARWYEEAEFRRLAAQVDWSEVAICCHNTVFDGAILSWLYGVKPALWIDTLSMARALHGVSGNSLGALAVKYNLGEKGDDVGKARNKRREDFSQVEWAQYGEYCKNDCDLTERLFKALRGPVGAPLGKCFPTAELRLIDLTLRCFTEPTWLGNIKLLENYQAEEFERKRALLDRVGAERGDLLSNDRFAQLLMDLGVEPPTKVSDRTGKETWAFAKTEPGMQDLLEHPEDDVRWLVEARVGVKSTINETRAGRFLAVARRGPIPVQLHYYGAHTGRWSGAGKMNFQNLQRGGTLRDALEAPEGYAIVVADSGAIEARGVSWLAKDETLMAGWRANADLYSQFASKVYRRKVDRKFKDADGKKPDEVPGQVGKVAILGLGYQMGAEKFARTLAAGPMGAKPVVFDAATAEAMGVDVEAFATERRVAKIAGIPSRLPLEQRLVHFAVAAHVHTFWRDENDAIQALWAKCEDALEAMDCDAPNLRLGPCIIERHAVLRPCGMRLRYPGLSYSDESGWKFLGGASGKKPTHLYGGKLTENIVQALARDVVAEQALRLSKRWHVITTTHDEVVMLAPVDRAEECLADAIREMSVSPAWAPDWPLTAEGGFGPSYGEAK